VRHHIEAGTRLDDARTLQRAFFDSATALFAPLVAEPGAYWSCSVTNVSVDSGESSFLASVDFATIFVAGSITFAQPGYDVDTVLGPGDSTIRYGIREWAVALEEADVVPHNTHSVLTVARMETTVADMARAVAALQGSIASAPAAVVARMEQARDKARDALLARYRTDEHHRDSVAAGDAFRKHEYARVVALLEPYFDFLTAADRRMLEEAKQKN
jgi:hypothetical protein